MKKLVLVGIGVAVIAIVAIVLLSTSGDSMTERDSGGSANVKLELRGKPPAKIRMNGRAIGSTPTAIVVPRSDKALEFEATFTIEKTGLAKPAKKIDIWRLTKSVVPDADQSVDFDIKAATKISESVGAP